MSLSKEMKKVVNDISAQRAKIKEDFAKAYLVTFEGNLNDAIRKSELVETWSQDRLQVTWHFRKRTK